VLNRRGFVAGAGAVSLAGLLAACSSGGSGSTQLSASAKQTLTMLNYEGWMGAKTVSGFKKQHAAVTIKQSDLPSGGGGAITTLVRQNPTAYDFALLGNGSAEAVSKAGVLADFDASKVPNLKNIPEQFRKAYPWGMPLEQGKVGIIYRKDLVTEPPTSWKDLFDRIPDDLAGKVVLPDYDVDVLSIGMLALGYDINSTVEAESRAAADLVIKVKPHVKAFLGSDRIKTLKSGSATVAVGYDYDTAGVLGKDDTIGWVAPSEGLPAYLDGWTVFGKSEHKAAVYEFMNFLLEPANYADFIDTTGASYLMPTAKSLISADISGNEALALDLSTAIVYEATTSGKFRTFRANLWSEIEAA
jgi:spermidine/putrescine transport system substrate-binding protein